MGDRLQTASLYGRRIVKYVCDACIPYSTHQLFGGKTINYLATGTPTMLGNPMRHLLSAISSVPPSPYTSCISSTR